MTEWNEATVNELANRLNPYTLARALLSELDDTYVEPTADNAYTLWLDILEHQLGFAVQMVVKFAPVFVREETKMNRMRKER